MCAISTPENQSKSLLIATRIPPKGRLTGAHFENKDYEVHYALSSEVLLSVQQHEPDYLLIAPQFDDGTDGIELCRAVRALPKSATKCLLLLSAGFHEFSKAFFADVSGYVYEKSPVEEIEIALTRLAAGERYFDRAVTKELPSVRIPSSQKNLELLSRREREIFQYMTYGYVTPEIAGLLFISSKTVETHKMHIAQKLGLSSVTELRHRGMQLIRPIDQMG